MNTQIEENSTKNTITSIKHAIELYRDDLASLSDFIILASKKTFKDKDEKTTIKKFLMIFLTNYRSRDNLTEESCRNLIIALDGIMLLHNKISIEATVMQDLAKQLGYIIKYDDFVVDGELYKSIIVITPDNAESRCTYSLKNFICTIESETYLYHKIKKDIEFYENARDILATNYIENESKINELTSKIEALYNCNAFANQIKKPWFKFGESAMWWKRCITITLRQLISEFRMVYDEEEAQEIMGDKAIETQNNKTNSIIKQG